MDWQRTNIQAAAAYLRERIAGGATDIRTRAAYEGLLEVLDPKRRTLRLQREQAEAAKASAPVPVAAIGARTTTGAAAPTAAA